MKIKELQEEIELNNYECVDNKTVFIVSRTYKGKRNLKDIISQYILEEIDAQLNSLKDIIMMSKRVIFGYPQGIILQNYVDGFHQI